MSAPPSQPPSARRTRLAWHLRIWMVPAGLAGTLFYLALRGADWRAIWTVLSRVRPHYFALACAVEAPNERVLPR